MNSGLLLSVLLSLALAPVTSPGPSYSQSPPPAAAVDPNPPANVGWDYQIGGARPVPAEAHVVVRDRNDPPAGAYPVCYVNGFQTQPDERAFWKKRPKLVLRDERGRPVVDANWGEQLLDLRTTGKRKRLARAVERWMRSCAEDGFVAVEIDNLDSWTRSNRLLTRRHAIAYTRLLTDAAHRHGLAVAQKNTAELLGKDLGFDFAVVEDCARWHECRTFADTFEGRVFIVEYSPRGWRTACRQVGDRVSVLLRDRNVSPPGPFRIC